MTWQRATRATSARHRRRRAREQHTVLGDEYDELAEGGLDGLLVGEDVGVVELDRRQQRRARPGSAGTWSPCRRRPCRTRQHRRRARRPSRGAMIDESSAARPRSKTTGRGPRRPEHARGSTTSSFFVECPRRRQANAAGEEQLAEQRREQLERDVARLAQPSTSACRPCGTHCRRRRTRGPTRGSRSRSPRTHRLLELPQAASTWAGTRARPEPRTSWPAAFNKPASEATSPSPAMPIK